MSNSKRAQVLNSVYQLLEQPTSLSFFEMVFRSDIVEQFSITAVFHDKKQPFGRLYNLVELDYRWMSDYFEDVDLPCNSLYVVNILNLPFVKYFDGDLLPSVNMETLLNLTKSALA